MDSMDVNINLLCCRIELYFARFITSLSCVGAKPRSLFYVNYRATVSLTSLFSQSSMQTTMYAFPIVRLCLFSLLYTPLLFPFNIPAQELKGLNWLRSPGHTNKCCSEAVAPWWWRGILMWALQAGFTASQTGILVWNNFASLLKNQVRLFLVFCQMIFLKSH